MQIYNLLCCTTFLNNHGKKMKLTTSYKPIKLVSVIHTTVKTKWFMCLR